jgi:putative transcriptional regulator
VTAIWINAVFLLKDPILFYIIGSVLCQNSELFFFCFFLQSQLDILCKANYTNNAKYAMQINRRCKMKTRIKELRKERKLSQEELALAVGTTRQTITSIEVGKYTASLVLAYKIAHYFGLTIEEVFDFSDQNEF